jgi:hypothetical protein
VQCHGRAFPAKTLTKGDEDWHLQHLGSLSLSGGGLVIVEQTAVEPAGRITHGCLGLYSDTGVKPREPSGMKSGRNRWFVDSPLEGNGFEPSVPRRARTADSATLV